MRRAIPILMGAMLSATLGGCAWEGSFGFLEKRPPPPPTPGGGHLVVVDGRIVEEPPTPIETVIEGMEQAQRVRSLTQQLNSNRRVQPK